MSDTLSPYLTHNQRIVLTEVGPPGEGPIPDEVFVWAIDQGYGFWGRDFWEVTEAGREALARDDAARKALNADYKGT